MNIGYDILDKTTLICSARRALLKWNVSIDNIIFVDDMDFINRTVFYTNIAVDKIIWKLNNLSMDSYLIWCQFYSQK